MSFLFFLVRHHEEIYQGAKLLAKMWKTARQATQEYIRNRLRNQMARSLKVAGFQLALLGSAIVATVVYPSLFTQILGSLVLWAVTLYNLYGLIWVTIPELIQVHRMLRGKVGYALKYFLKVSVVTELMQGDLLFLGLSIGVAASSRSWLGLNMSYWDPWAQLLNLPLAP